MRHYQLFPFSRDGRLLDAVSMDVESDVRAIRYAITGEFPHGCELWEGFRFVGRFHGAAVQAAAEVEVEEVKPPVAVLVH
jgi:hypothetical protein